MGEEKSLRILKLQAENIKRLKAVEISPDGNVVQITGRNGEGKTSVLDSIWWALAGTRNVQEVPVRQGTAAGRIRVTLGDDGPELLVTRSFSPKGSRLSVTNPDGSLEFKKPQDMLDALTRALSFDPLEFARMKAKEQRDLLLGLGQSQFDIEAHDEKYKEKFQERTLVNRQREKAQGYADTLPQYSDAPEDEDSISELGQKLTEANKIKTERDTKCQALAAKEREYLAAMETVSRLKEELDQLIVVVDTLPEAPDIDALQTKMDTVEETNAMVRANKIKADALEEAEKLQRQYDDLTKELRDLDDEKTEALGGLSLGIDGVEITTEGVLYNGVPFSQASSADQLRVSLQIAMAPDPTIKVLRVTDGSLLDSKSLGIIRELTGEKGYQIWIEQVDESGEVGIYIEDGEVKAQQPALV